MPTYHYQAKTHQSCTHCAGGFDVFQKLSEDKLSVCPECQAPVKKIIQAPLIAGKMTRDANSTLSEKNIEKQGFTQYRKVGQGKYEKTAGKGPNFIDKEQL